MILLYKIGFIRLNKNADSDKKNYGIGFDSRSLSLLHDGSMGRNVIIFRADLNSSVHIDNKGKYLIILG